MSTRKYRAASLTIAVTAAFLLTGGYYITESFYVGSLTIRGFYISESDGRACLTSDHNMGAWYLSTPTVAMFRGHYYYLAYSLDKHDPKVYFAREKGKPTEWTFVNIKRFEPRSYRNDSKGDAVLKEGEEGYDFQLVAKNGPYAGWYLAEGPAGKRASGEETDDSARPLILVKERRRAATLRYVQHRHHTISKEK